MRVEDRQNEFKDLLAAKVDFVVLAVFNCALQDAKKRARSSHGGAINFP